MQPAGVGVGVIPGDVPQAGGELAGAFADGQPAALKGVE